MVSQFLWKTDILDSSQVIKDKDETGKYSTSVNEAKRGVE